MIENGFELVMIEAQGALVGSDLIVPIILVTRIARGNANKLPNAFGSRPDLCAAA